MNSLLNALYEILSYVTEDARANKLLGSNFPEELYNLLNDCCIKLGDYLDKIDNP